jgi:hypothetical protein
VQTVFSLFKKNIFILFKINKFLVFLDYFDVIILKIFFLKKYYFNIFKNKKKL